MDFLDINVFAKDRKTIANVMTVGHAIKSSKASKNHKIKPRSSKNDRTKTNKAKTFSRNRNFDRNIKLI
jgi:hypothetical protein